MPVDYITFQDNDLQVPTAGGAIAVNVPFSTPNVDTTKNGYLSVEVNPFTGTPTLEFDINGTTVYAVTFAVNSQRVVQENFALSLLNPVNTLTVRVTGGGTVKVSDIHVLFKTL
jgi:hypothetical protein